MGALTFDRIIGLISSALVLLVGAVASNYLGFSWIALIVTACSLLIILISWFFHRNFSQLRQQQISLADSINDLSKSLIPDHGGGYSWEYFWRQALQLAEIVENDGFRPDIIIGHGRSGGVLGGMLASEWGVTFVVVDRKYALKSGRNVPTDRTAVEIDGTVALEADALKDKKILCVMAECKTGHTLHNFFQDVSQMAADARTAVVITKSNVIFEPTYAVVRTEEDWPSLPWRSSRWKRHHP